MKTKIETIETVSEFATLAAIKERLVGKEMLIHDTSCGTVEHFVVEDVRTANDDAYMIYHGNRGNSLFNESIKQLMTSEASRITIDNGWFTYEMIVLIRERKG